METTALGVLYLGWKVSRLGVDDSVLCPSNAVLGQIADTAVLFWLIFTSRSRKTVGGVASVIIHESFSSVYGIRRYDMKV